MLCNYLLYRQNPQYIQEYTTKTLNVLIILLRGYLSNRIYIYDSNQSHSCI
jgi:hypothetical protein